MDSSKQVNGMTDKDAFEFEMLDSDDDSTNWENMSMDSDEICSPDIIDVTIEDAKNHKNAITSTMELVRSLKREVEEKEKVAEEAVEEAGRTSLDILAMIDKLKIAKQSTKETNDMQARKVNSQKAALAIEMKKLQHRASDMLNEGDGSIKDLDEMLKSLEKRLSSAMKKKEEAEKEKLAKEKALEHEQRLMQKIVEESKRLKQEEEEILKLQEFLIDRGQVVETLEEDIYCRCEDVNMLKRELIDYEDENGILDTECSLRPIIQETIPKEPCKCWTCCTSKSDIRFEKRRKTRVNYQNKKEQKKWNEGLIEETVAEYGQNLI